MAAPSLPLNDDDDRAAEEEEARAEKGNRGGAAKEEGGQSTSSSTRSLLTTSSASVQDELATSLPSYRKWLIVAVYFSIQLAIHFNTGVYASGVDQISEHFSVSTQAARVGQSVYLLAYAVGALLWSPWSEDKGRKGVLQLSLTLTNATQILCALAPNFGSIVVGRALGGLFSVIGSLSIGVVADLFGDRQQYAVAVMVFGSVGGSALGPVVGPFVEAYLDWPWYFWLQLIFGGTVQLLHLLLIPETRSRTIIERHARLRRRKYNEDIWAEHETETRAPLYRRALTTWKRPFQMLLTEPIVIYCSLLSGFSDALIFSFMGSFKLVYAQWGFEAPLIATAFAPIWIGYFLCLASFIYPIEHFHRLRKTSPERVTPESRLFWLLFTGPLLVPGLFGFAWTSLGPPTTPWIAPMLFSALIGIANLAIYITTIDYVVKSYGPYSSSAASCNTFVRNTLAGAAAMYTNPMYKTLGYEWASTLLAFVSVALVVPMFFFYYKGEWVRSRSQFAQQVMRKERS